MTDALIRLCTEHEFGVIFARMAMQLRWLDADTAAIQSYYVALKDLPDEIVHASAARIANEPGRKFFPTTGEWREVALRIEQDKRRAEFSGPESWTDECATCHDTGWEVFECTGGVHVGCDRPREHRPHDFVRICPCRPTNRTYQRHQWKAKAS